MTQKSAEYDYVIVGAGSAGCVLASHLSSNPGVSVLLVEAGGWDTDPWISIPLGWGKIFAERRHDWMYFTEPEPSLAGRSIECARGKVIGGSSSINAMAYVRGNRLDFDRWAASGLKGWSYADVLPYFKRQESWEDGANAYRGGGGPIATRRSRYADPLVEAYIEAGGVLGYPYNGDYNAAEQDGFALLQSTIGKGRRCSASVAYLHPILQRRNLEVATRSLVTSVRVSGGKAEGIRYLGKSGMVDVVARREVLLAAGSVNTPHLLMHSGIGEPAELAAHGIRVAVPLSGVGKNLRDHFSVAVEYDRADTGPFVAAMRLDRAARNVANAYLRGKGLATDLPSGWTGFVRSDASKTQPDIQFLFRAVPAAAGPYLPPFKKAYADGFACRAVLVRPESTGAVRISSDNPRDPPRIQQNPLTVDSDVKALRSGLRLAFELGRQKAVLQFIGRNRSPVHEASSVSDLDAFMRVTAQTAHHPMGTCRMGNRPDEGDVVDEELKVHGVAGLRVVDASVFPDAIGGNINAAVMMIAERASDLICGREPLRGIYLV